MTRATFVLFLACGLVAVSDVPASSQATCTSMKQCPGLILRETGLRQELTTAGLNMLIGGTTAALFRLIDGDFAWNALWKGGLGGGLAYVGKRVAVEDFYAAGLVGREVASVGGSVVRNASTGRGLLEEVVLPLGPVRLYVSKERGIIPRVDLATVVASGAFLAIYDARLDFEASLSSGALVFRGTPPMPGVTTAGAMVVWPDMPAMEGPRLMAHERIHVIQYDQISFSWGERAERWVTGQTPGVGDILDRFDLGITALSLQTGLSWMLDYHVRPWEREAYLLAQMAHPVPGL